LGIGAFGVVLLVVNRHTLEDSALKIINKTRISPEAREFLRNESSILKDLNGPKLVAELNNCVSTEDSSPGGDPKNIYGHPSIVKFKQIFDNPIFAVIEMEYVQGGLLKRLFKLPLPEAKVS
jgi:serine/threonine protein kinase